MLFVEAPQLLPLRLGRLVIGDGPSGNHLARRDLKSQASPLLVRQQALSVAGIGVSEQPLPLIRRQRASLPGTIRMEAEEADLVGERRSNDRCQEEVDDPSGYHAVHLAAAENVSRAFAVSASTSTRYTSDSTSLCSTSMFARPRFTDS